jgi:hypothetical protein
VNRCVGEQETWGASFWLKNAFFILRLLGLVNNRQSLARNVLDGSISEEARIEGEYSTDEIRPSHQLAPFVRQKPRSMNKN